ncbi:MAG: DNA polymerase II large subunit [Candidatus Pacearchaeota archaeon]
MQQYFKEIENKVKVAYSIAGEARAKGLDPVSIVEIPLATSLAERVTGLISTKYPQVRNSGIEKRIKELEKQYGFLDSAICLQIAEEVAKERFCKFQNMEEALDAGIRIAFAYITLGVVSSPLEGFTHFKIKKTIDGKDYMAVYYSGPIRSAGSTTAAFSLLIIDHLREVFGFAKYDPTEQEIKRMITEIYDYHERVANLQYLPTEQEIYFMFKNLPIQVTGDPSEEREVSNYKDLARIETNKIRNGPCLVLGEGLAQKSFKILKRLNHLREKGFKLTDWDWLKDFTELQKKLIAEKKEKATGTYIQDIVAGRPVFSHPSRSGGFRLRYGRARTSGYSAIAISPLTMVLLNNFIAIGTQIKLEKPTKAAAVTSCDTIEGPIVKLKDGSLVKIKDLKEANEIKPYVEEIVYLGDILISYGDFLNRNHILLPAGYNEEWWYAELLEKDKIEAEKINPLDISLDKAIELSEKYEIPLHPKYIFYWSQINYELFFAMLKWLEKAKIINGKLILDYTEKEKKAKRALELLGVEHKKEGDKFVVDEIITKAFFLNLGKRIEEINELIRQPEQREGVLEFINSFSKYKIKDKAGTFIGARMGRPEKAKLRKLVGSPHVLFPVGEAGGRMRSVQEAMKSYVEADFPIYFCDNCKQETIYFICEKCNNKTRKLCYCPLCERIVGENCPQHGGIQGGKVKTFMQKRIDLSYYVNSALNYLNIQKTDIPELIKGVRGTSSEEHIPEHIAKGILRAQFSLNVNKDGTIRYDASEVPITHFKPKEIDTEIKKLKELGYTKDIFGKELVDKEQILCLKPQDIILPSCPETLDEKADDVFVNIAKFIDNLLVRFYKQKPFYNVKSRDDLVGHLVVGIAPHNCAGVVGRIIGFSKTQTFLASPYMHAAMRRDCDGDEAAIMLLLDLLLNFSKKFLPAHRGGTQDAPLVLNARIRASEVDDMILDMDITKNLPLELYKAAEEFKSPSSIKIENIGTRLGEEEKDANVFEDLWFTHDTLDINNGTICSSYKTLETMQDKVKAQMELAEKIRAVDTTDVARLVIERHFIRDIRGNLRKFSGQQFRCVDCNTKYRRPPLTGKCLNCNGRIIFTIAEGSIVKYLEPALQLAEKYNISPYLKQSLELTKSYIESIFGKELEKQQDLERWF